MHNLGFVNFINIKVFRMHFTGFDFYSFHFRRDIVSALRSSKSIHAKAFIVFTVTFLTMMFVFMLMLPKESSDHSSVDRVGIIVWVSFIVAILLTSCYMGCQLCMKDSFQQDVERDDLILDEASSLNSRWHRNYQGLYNMANASNFMGLADDMSDSENEESEIELQSVI